MTSQANTSMAATLPTSTDVAISVISSLAVRGRGSTR